MASLAEPLKQRAGYEIELNHSVQAFLAALFVRFEKFARHPGQSRLSGHDPGHEICHSGRFVQPNRIISKSCGYRSADRPENFGENLVELCPQLFLFAVVFDGSKKYWD